MARLSDYLPKWKLADLCDFHELAAGSRSVILLARHRESRKPYVLKRFCRDTLDMRDLVEEAEVHAPLRHPHIIRCYAYFRTQRYVGLVLEYAPRGDLFEFFRHRAIPPDTAARLCRQLLLALKYCHDQGIVHSDVKPENVLIDVRGNVKLADFGLAYDLEPYQSKRPPYRGTTQFMPPEILRRKTGLGVPHPATVGIDLWSVGVTLYEVLARENPFFVRRGRRKGSGAAEDAHLRMVRGTGDIEWPRSVPVDARKLIRRLLKVNPFARLTARGALSHPFIIDRTVDLEHANEDGDDEDDDGQRDSDRHSASAISIDRASITRKSSRILPVKVPPAPVLCRCGRYHG